MECSRCGASGEEQRLGKCPMCFKWVCERCVVRNYGREFCGNTCANLFFFGDEDD